MKAATTIFLIVLILFVSFAALGYLSSQFGVLQSQNRELRQQNESLTIALNQAQADLQDDKMIIDELTVEVQDLTGRLNEEISAKQYYAGLVQTCEANNKMEVTSSRPLFSTITVPLLFVMLLAGMKRSFNGQFCAWVIIVAL